MEYAHLKGTDLKVSRIGMGCAQIASASTPRSAHEIERAVHAALDHGINYFDTADSYGQGDSERRLGKALKGRRDGIVVSSKVGYNLGQSNSIIRALKPLIKSVVKRVPGTATAVSQARSRMIRNDFSVQHIQKAIDQTLLRLKFDYVDLYFLHDAPPSVLEDHSLVEALNGLVAVGKVRHWAISVKHASEAAQVINQRSAKVIQMPVNVADSDACDRVLPQIGDADIGIVAREAFAQGLFNSPPADMRSILNQSELPVRFAAMRYVLKQPGVDTLLVGMSQEAHVIENCTIFDRPNLTDQQIASLTSWRREKIAEAQHSQ